MTYNILDRIAPVMPKPSKVTEIVKLLLSQASKDMREPLVPMLFPVLGAHMSGAKRAFGNAESTARRSQKYGSTVTKVRFDGHKSTACYSGFHPCAFSSNSWSSRVTRT